MSATKKCSPKNIVFNNIRIMATFSEISEKENDEKRRPHSKAKI